jgi:hypothetical protein
MSSETPKPQQTQSEQPDQSPIYRLSPPKNALPESLEFSEKLNPVKISIQITMPDGKVIKEDFAMGGFILLGQAMYLQKDNPEKAVMLPETCSTFNHRADVVDLIEKFKLQLYLSSIVQGMANIPR